MKDFYTVAEIAELLTWSEKRTRRWVHRNKLGFKTGRDGSQLMIASDRLRAEYPEIVDALHRKALTREAS